MNLKKSFVIKINRILLIIIILTVILSVLVFIIQKKRTKTASGKNISYKSTVIIDAGHGGFDGGATAKDGTNEKDLNLPISLALGDIFSLNGYDVVYTRTDDSSTETDESATIKARKVSDIKNRIKLSEKHKDSVYLSIHINKFTSSYAKGAQVFYSPQFDTAKLISAAIQNTIIEDLQPDNDRTVKSGTKSTYILYNAVVPTVLVECGFLSNGDELKKLKDSTYQKQLAFCIFKGYSKSIKAF